jgi:hypothetical protein
MREQHRIHTDQVDSDQLDLLQHLREQRLLQRMALPDVPLAGFDGPSNGVPFLEKELLSELTCQICYTLFYEPVTTPCQHVRLSHSLSSCSPANISARHFVLGACTVPLIIAYLVPYAVGTFTVLPTSKTIPAINSFYPSVS